MNNLQGLIEQIKAGIRFSDSRMVKDYYGESYASITVNKHKIQVLLVNRWVHGSISEDDFVSEGFIRVIHPNGTSDTYGKMEDECEYLLNLIEHNTAEEKRRWKKIGENLLKVADEQRKWLFREPDNGVATMQQLAQCSSEDAENVSLTDDEFQACLDAFVDGELDVDEPEEDELEVPTNNGVGNDTIKLSEFLSSVEKEEIKKKLEHAKNEMKKCRSMQDDIIDRMRETLDKLYATPFGSSDFNKAMRVLYKDSDALQIKEQTLKREIRDMEQRMMLIV